MRLNGWFAKSFRKFGRIVVLLAVISLKDEWVHCWKSRLTFYEDAFFDAGGYALCLDKRWLFLISCLFCTRNTWSKTFCIGSSLVAEGCH
jgi:hypothetical protein